MDTETVDLRLRKQQHRRDEQQCNGNILDEVTVFSGMLAQTGSPSNGASALGLGDGQCDADRGAGALVGG